MRTKEKIEICTSITGENYDFTYTDKSLVKVGESFLVINKDDAIHLVSCWNAFEPGGIVERMKKLLPALIRIAGTDDFSEEDWKAADEAESLLAELEEAL